jgi:ABC-type multidrug transport system ATPase subunit
MSSRAKLLNTTIVMALQQPEPAVTALFDDVILMAEGYTLWHGPVSKTLAHFEGATGVKALPGQDLADYLMQVAAAPTQQQQQQQQQLQQQQQQGLLVKADGSSSGGSSGSSVMSAAQLSAAFWESRQGSSLKVGSEGTRS